MNYKYYNDRPERLTADFIGNEYRSLIARVEPAENDESPELWLKLYADWNALDAYIAGEGSRISYAYSRDMTDKVCEEADRYMREEVSPIIADGESAMVAALLRSRHRNAIAERYGRQVIRKCEVSVQTLDPVNRDIRVRAGSVAKEYSKIVASGEVMVNGEKMTMAMAGSYLVSENRDLRRQAYEAVMGWYLEHRDQLAAIFDQLVKLRTEMGRNVGHENFIPLGYFGMGRTDYGPQQTEEFRRNVRTFAVPLLRKLRARQAAELGLEALKPWDTGYDPSLTLPVKAAPVETQLDNAGRVFESLSPALAAHFTRMRNEGLIDLENRKGKQAGAYCTTFPDEGRAAIFCNSTGDADDVRTLVHEMGHAFQKWESQPIEAIALQYATADAAEIHSMGMEYLSMRHMNEFFDQENAVKFRRGRWKKAITLLCYVAVVDEFQHWVYRNPDATPDERDAAWCRIWDIYEQGTDYSGVEKYKALRWYQQMHIFRAPFYYIDYAIAETGAMQLALIDNEDHERAMDIYMNLCRIGGTMSVLEIFTTAGLRSPFEPELMRDLMNHAASELGVEEEVTV